MLRVEDMEALFSCKEGFHIRVNNFRHVAILFDALLEKSQMTKGLKLLIRCIPSLTDLQYRPVLARKVT